MYLIIISGADENVTLHHCATPQPCGDDMFTCENGRCINKVISLSHTNSERLFFSNCCTYEYFRAGCVIMTTIVETAAMKVNFVTASIKHVAVENSLARIRNVFEANTNAMAKTIAVMILLSPFQLIEFCI